MNEAYRPPRPIPALRELERVPEPGEEERAFIPLHRNERLAPLPAWFVEELRARIDSELLTRYPVSDRAYAALSASVGLPRERLLLTAGSDAAVRAVFHAFVQPGDAVVTLEPSYAMYGVYAQMFGARREAVAVDDDLDVDDKHLLAAIRPGVRLVALSNPNQPTGTLLEPARVLQVARRAAEVGALLAVDEAYYPFSRTTVLPHVRHVPNLAVVRTLSKAAGVAGLRVGFVSADEAVVSALSKVRSVHDVNAIALESAKLVMEHPEVVDEYVALVEEGGRLLANRCGSLGLSAVPPHANFMLLRVPPPATPQALAERLRVRGFLVRAPVAVPRFADYLRVTLGPPSLMEQVADALALALAEILPDTAASPGA